MHCQCSTNYAAIETTSVFFIENLFTLLGLIKKKDLKGGEKQRKLLGNSCFNRISWR